MLISVACAASAACGAVPAPNWPTGGQGSSGSQGAGSESTSVPPVTAPAQSETSCPETRAGVEPDRVSPAAVGMDGAVVQHALDYIRLGRLTTCVNRKELEGPAAGA